MHITKITMGNSVKKYYLFFTIFITGAVIMVLELVGTRVIAPVYGSGLFVWASLITITLTCLSMGYWIGGRISDRKPNFTMFYLIILISGILISPISKISMPVLKWSVNMGFRAGPLLSAFILFGIPMVLLGMLSPYAIRLATIKLDILGATAGKLYAISTFGSFIGTVLTGFVLIPNIGSKKILFLQSLILILLWVGHNILNRKYPLGLTSAFFISFPVLFTYVPFFQYAKYQDVKLVYESETFYGQIKIIDKGDERKLYLDNINQSSVNKYTYNSMNWVPYSFEMLPIFNKQGKKAILIGLAGANIPRLLWRYGINTDCVEIEPKMEYISRKYFGFLDNFGNVHIKDGRAYINKLRAQDKYDFVIIDAFTGDEIPFHLLTKESFKEIEQVLETDGVLGINFIEGCA